MKRCRAEQWPKGGVETKKRAKESAWIEADESLLELFNRHFGFSFMLLSFFSEAIHNRKKKKKRHMGLDPGNRRRIQKQKHRSVKTFNHVQ